MEKNNEGEMKNEEEENEEEFQEEVNQNDVQEEVENEQVDDGEEDDDRLTYTLITLDLGNLIHIFEDNNISFVDMLLLSKDDLIELQLEIFQRNRILNFSKLFTKYAKNYSIREISDFFTFNKQFIFNSSIYDKVFANNMNMYQNDMSNNNFNIDNNYDMMNPDLNLNNANTNQNLNENMNNNYISQAIINNNDINNNNNNSSRKYDNAQAKSNNKPYNINGGAKKNKNMNANFANNKNINNDNNLNQDNAQNKLMDLIIKRKTPKYQNTPIQKNQNLIKGKSENATDRNYEYQKLIEKIGLLESYEMNYDLYSRLNLIKNYINNKGDKITIEDITNINNDIDPIIKKMNNNLNNKNDFNLNNNEENKKNNRIKVIKKH